MKISKKGKFNLKSYITPPAFQDEEQKNIASILSVITISTVAGLCGLIIYRLLTNYYLDIIPMLVLCAVIFGSFFLLHRRQLTWASTIALWCMLAFINYESILNKGVHNIVLYIIPGILIVAGLVLKHSHYWFIACSSLLSIGIIGYLETIGKIQNIYNAKTTWVDILDLLVMLGVIAVIIYLLSTKLRNSVVHMQNDEKEIRRQSDQLRITQKRYQVLFEGANDAIFILSGDLFVECNFTALKMFKSERSTDIINHRIWELSPHTQPDGSNSEEKINKIIHTALEKASQHFYWKFKRIDGTLFDADVSLSLLEYGDEVFNQVLVRDITERKQTEERLNLFSQTIRSISEAITITDLENNLLFVNEGFVSIYGYEKDEVIGKSINIINADPALGGDEVIKGTLQGGWQGEILNRKKDGTLFPIFLSTSIVTDEEGKPIALVGVATDISERKRTERMLQVREKKYQDIIMWAPIGIYQSSQSGKLLNANSSIATMLGYKDANELVGCEMWRDIYYDRNDRDQFIAKHNASGKNVSISTETQWKKKDGTIIWVLMTVHDVRDKSGEILYYEGFVFDITERRKADEALRESEERYRLLVENSTDIVTEIDAEGNYLYVSPNVKTILKFEPVELVGLSVLSKVYPKDKGLMEEILSSQGGSAMYRYRDKTGEWHWFESSSRVYKLSSGERRIVMVSRDITQRRKSEQELERSRKQLQHFTEHLEHILEEERKRISRELHDELGQLLTILKFDLSWLRLEGVKGDSEVTEKIDSMMESLNEALASVKRISKEIRPPQLDALGLSGAIQWDIEQVEKKTGFKGTVIVEPTESEIKGQISTVLYRIFREALTNVIRHAQAKHVLVKLSQEHDSVILTVRDDGRGITKKELKGETSLGLVGIRERVRIVGGTFKIEGTPNKGTVLTVEVPLRKKKIGESEL